MSGPYWIFLDDLREVAQVYKQPEVSNNPLWVVARSFEEATKLILERGCPMYISFDNDLGEAKEGYDLALWLTEKDLDGVIDIPKDFDFFVHSANPVSWNRISSLLHSYHKYKHEGVA